MRADLRHREAFKSGKADVVVLPGSDQDRTVAGGHLLYCRQIQGMAKDKSGRDDPAGMNGREQRTSPLIKHREAPGGLPFEVLLGGQSFCLGLVGRDSGHRLDPVELNRVSQPPEPYGVVCGGEHARLTPRIPVEIDQAPKTSVGSLARAPHF